MMIELSTGDVRMRGHAVVLLFRYCYVHIASPNPKTQSGTVVQRTAYIVGTVYLYDYCSASSQSQLQSTDITPKAPPTVPTPISTNAIAQSHTSLQRELARAPLPPPGKLAGVAELAEKRRALLGREASAPDGQPDRRLREPRHRRERAQ